MIIFVQQLTNVKRFAIVKRMKNQAKTFTAVQDMIILSDKYQVVIPKSVRKGLNLQPGQKLRISRNTSGNITIKTGSVLDELYGSMKGMWGPDSDAYVRDLRNEADRDRA